LRSELRRVILAFAARTASLLVDRFFGSAVFGLASMVGMAGCNGVGAIEPCSTGCTFMGPVNDDLRRGIDASDLGNRRGYRSSTPGNLQLGAQTFKQRRRTRPLQTGFS
jgi:hypothetical protein